ADEQLPGGLGERFVMCNGDVLTDLDLRRQIELHEELGATATLGLAPVEDPSAYGLVRVGDDLSVAGFLEKPEPEEIDTDLISAGAYVLERSVLDLVEPGRSVSIEREVWPRLVGHGLYGIADRDAYWLDIGTPERYLEATADILSGRARTSVARELDGDGLSVAPGASVEGELAGPAMVGEGAAIAAGATVGPGSVIGPGAQVGPGARVVRSVVLDRARVGEGALIEDAILAPEAQVGAASEVTGMAVLGPRALVGAENRLGDGVRLFPDAELGDRAVAFCAGPSDSRAGEMPESEPTASLDAETVAAADPSGQVFDVLALPEQLRDALFKAESAELPETDSPGGLVVAGMG
ncbi:MAG: sugar phosphate nucleotidyltransferase, partial [Solirubrobacterales bacterium]